MNLHNQPEVSVSSRCTRCGLLKPRWAKEESPLRVQRWSRLITLFAAQRLGLGLSTRR